MRFEEWFNENFPRPVGPTQDVAAEYPYWMVRSVAMATWNASRVYDDTPEKVAGTMKSAVFDGGLPHLTSVPSGIQLGGVWYDLVKREPASPALTRADILRWPESDDGRQRLREECAKIADVELDGKGNIKGEHDIEAAPGYYYEVPVKFQPDRDANQCRMVKAALVGRGYNIRLTSSRGTSSRWYAEVFAPADNMRWGEAHADTEEQALCLTACIATLVAP